MKKFGAILGLLLVLMLSFSGCTAIGEKTLDMSFVYGALAVLSLMTLIGYCVLVAKKDVWFLLLFASVFVVNIGYFALSISSTLEEALLANRIAYLGSVFLPMSMLMNVLNITKLKLPKWLPSLLFGIGVLVFLVAASPGYLDIYYKEVSLGVFDGATVLHKIYGPWHCLYMFYLLGHFLAMVITIIYAAVKQKIEASANAFILIITVFVNVGVWLIEQLVEIEFEILSVTYIISELFLLGLHLIITENQKLREAVKEKEVLVSPEPIIDEDIIDAQPDAQPGEPKDADDGRFQIFVEGLERLTPTEKAIYEAYLSRITTKEIMATMGIKENTLKFHNKNIYGKLGVSSRKELLEIHGQIKGAKSTVKDTADITAG